MLVIVRANDWRLIDCRQDVKAAWRLAHALAWKTGVYHWVGRIQDIHPFIRSHSWHEKYNKVRAKDHSRAILAGLVAA
jgi:hypothetical protein